MSAANVDLASATPDPVSRDSNGSSAVTETGRIDGGSQRKRQRRPAKDSLPVCRYYATTSGCRAGDNCRFRHVAKQQDERAVQSSSRPSTDDQADTQSPTPKSTSDTTNTRHTGQNLPRRPVTKPVSTAQQVNPREFEISQVVRRFAPKREDEPNGTTKLSLSLKPSDPDFAFDLEALQFTLIVPQTWPAVGTRPNIIVHNTEIPKGFQINIERGFGSLIQPRKTLLALLNDLDRHLERFLSSEKAQTIKIVANRAKPDPSTPSETVTTSATSLFKEPAIAENPITSSVRQTPQWTADQKVEAKAKRSDDVRQLEARMGRLPLFSAFSDGRTFNVPISYAKPGRLPLSLRALKEATLHVPQLYNLEPCTISLKGVSGVEAENVESAFAEYVRDHKDLTLMAQINYLTQHLPTMAESSSISAPTSMTPAIPEDLSTTAASTENDTSHRGSIRDELQSTVDEDRPHLVFLSRPPPEWSRAVGKGGDASASDSYDEYGSDEEGTESSEDEDDEDDFGSSGGATVPPPVSSSNPEKGVMLSFPNLEMTGIELLQIYSLSISVKCDRCKEAFEFRSIKPTNAATSPTTITRTGSCNKCASPLSASYRAELVHSNSIKAGYLDLEGCTVQDILPSNFLPTCSTCSTTQAAPGTIAVRGDTSLAICHECHAKQTFKIHETKLLRVSAHDPRLHQALPPRRRKKEDLGITAGTELPDRGRCKHYSKSYRWFRFSCCNRVYPCDRCHDDAEPHPNEHANRMICGWCSREQNYRPEDCSLCQKSVIRRARGGFWEGGRGTRDKLKMSRKDPRKFKRIGGGGTGSK